MPILTGPRASQVRSLAVSPVPAEPGLEQARRMLERMWQQPAVKGAVNSSIVPRLLRSVDRLGAFGAAALFGSSWGELEVLKVSGRVPRRINLRQWQLAGVAFASWNSQWKMPTTSTPEQFGHVVEQAAKFEQQRSAGQINNRKFIQEMGLLARQVEGRARPSAPPSTLMPRLRPAAAAAVPSAAPRAPKTLHGRDAVQHRTPATPRAFQAYASQAARALAPRPSSPATLPALGRQRPMTHPKLPALRSEITHTRGTGAVTGTEAARLAKQYLEARGKALHDALLRVQALSRTLLPGGSTVAQIARAVYADSGLRALGVSEEAFVAKAGTLGIISEAHGPGGVRASTGSSSGAGGAAPRSFNGDASPTESGRSVARLLSQPSPVVSGLTPAARLKAFLTSAGQPEHLIESPDGTAFSVEPDGLNPEVRTVYRSLVDELGKPGKLDGLLTSLVVGYSTGFGLKSVGAAWRDRRYDELTGDLLVKLGQVLFNDPKFGTLDDLAGLAGLEAPGYRGIYSPQLDRRFVGSAIHPQEMKTLSGLKLWPTVDEMTASPWLLQRLREIQEHVDTPSQEPDTLRPWNRSSAPGFVSTVAGRMAFWAHLQSGGLSDEVLLGLQNNTGSTWAEVTERVPGLRYLDFGKSYASTLDAWHRSLPDVMGPYESGRDALAVKRISTHAATEMFKARATRRFISALLPRLFTDPRALQAYLKSREFALLASRYVADRIEPDLRFSLPWTAVAFSEGLLAAAKMCSAMQPGMYSNPFRALEALATDKGSQLLATLREQFMAADLLDALSIGNIEQTVGVWRAVSQDTPSPGTDRALNSTPPPKSIYESVLGILGRAGIVAILKADPESAGRIFVVDRTKSGASPEPQDLSQLMNEVCKLLNPDHPARWEYLPEQSDPGY